MVPKAHYADIYSIPEEVLAGLISSCKMHALRWRERVGATGVNILNASGVDAEQSVFHFLGSRTTDIGHCPRCKGPIRRAKRCMPDFGSRPNELARSLAPERSFTRFLSNRYVIAVERSRR